MVPSIFKKKNQKKKTCFWQLMGAKLIWDWKKFAKFSPKNFFYQKKAKAQNWFLNLKVWGPGKKKPKFPPNFVKKNSYSQPGRFLNGVQKEKLFLTKKKIFLKNYFDYPKFLSINPKFSPKGARRMSKKKKKGNFGLLGGFGQNTLFYSGGNFCP